MKVEPSSGKPPDKEGSCPPAPSLRQQLLLEDVLQPSPDASAQGCFFHRLLGIPRSKPRLPCILGKVLYLCPPQPCYLDQEMYCCPPFFAPLVEEPASLAWLPRAKEERPKECEGRQVLSYSETEWREVIFAHLPGPAPLVGASPTKKDALNQDLY